MSLSNSANGSGMFPISGVEANIEMRSLSDGFEVVVLPENHRNPGGRLEAAQVGR